jgi:hypothetical protein
MKRRQIKRRPDEAAAKGGEARWVDGHLPRLVV